MFFFTNYCTVIVETNSKVPRMNKYDSIKYPQVFDAKLARGAARHKLVGHAAGYRRR